MKHTLTSSLPQYHSLNDFRWNSEYGIHNKCLLLQRKSCYRVISNCKFRHQFAARSLVFTRLEQPRRSALINVPLLLGLLLAPGAANASNVDTKTFKGKLGFTFQYPLGFLEVSNRTGDEGKQSDGSQSVALVGNFTTFETISVSRHPLEGLDLTAVDSLVEKFISGGNVRTDILSITQSSDSQNFNFEYITETCRGNLEDGKGGIPDCVSPRDGSFLQTILRHHVASAVSQNGYFWVITASSAQKRWLEISDILREAVNSFKFE